MRSRDPTAAKWLFAMKVPTSRAASACSEAALLAALPDVHERAVYAIDWSRDPDGADLVASAGADDAICLVRATVGADGDGSLTLVGTRPDAHERDINSVAWSAVAAVGATAASAASGAQSERLLASCGDDGVVRLWRTA